jgi:MoxR-like ATPase
MTLNELQTITNTVRGQMETVIVGKGHEISLVIAALLSNGHVLLEDVPGTGKTTLAKTLALCFDVEYRRIQFTPDLLPSDMTGINFYSPQTGEFEFRPGGLFTNILLADEINRATPRTQSGLLESMEEKQITVDGVTYKLKAPYLVIATQNPIETQGTFPLPEAQLDRFLMRLSLGYPPTGEVINRFIHDDPIRRVSAVCTASQLIEMQEAVKAVRVHADLIKYISDVAEATRSHEAVSLGVSPRGALALTRAAQSWAAMQGRGYVIPDDIKALAGPVFTHRLILRGGHKSGQGARVLEEVLASVPVPTEDFS